MKPGYEGTRLGDITLCAGCGFAIQLRRFNTCLATYDLWCHFRWPITPHTAQPTVIRHE